MPAARRRSFTSSGVRRICIILIMYGATDLVLLFSNEKITS